MEIEHWFGSIPVVTRVYLTLCCAAAIAVTYDVVSPLDLYFSKDLTFRRGQWWRLLSCFCFFDQLSVNFFFHMHFIYMFSRKLEEHFYLGRWAEYLYFLVRAQAILLCVANIVDLPFLSACMGELILYVWSRRYPDEQLSLYGLVVIPAPYLPFAMMALTYSIGGASGLVVDCAGILVGHVLWYFSDVFPKIAGFDPMKPPKALMALLRLG
jgi:Derlin-2/3